MTVVSAFLVPGSPLPYVRRDNPPWKKIAEGMEAAGRALAKSRPDALVVYSTQWIAVLDQLWQTRSILKGVHVDENWHEYGDLPFDIRTDRPLAELCVENTAQAGIKAKGVDYDAFPVDTGTIVAAHFLNPDKLPMVITANNVYHDWAKTRTIAQVAVHSAEQLRRKIAIVAVGNLSGSIFRTPIDIKDDRIATGDEDQWNRKMLALLEKGDIAGAEREAPAYAAAAKVDMGFKHFAFVLGACGDRIKGATVHAYGPLYGSGGAVIEFKL
jgi:2-aminophenol/2-amino-5-chlorophenol 1,6-dioxygenase alpha subunit